MFHTHVKALFNHRVFQIDIRSRTNCLIGAMLMVKGLKTFKSKSLILTIKNSTKLIRSCFHSFTSRLLECSRSDLFLSSKLVFRLTCDSNLLSFLCWVLSWTWHIKLQALSIEYLVIVESRRCLIKSNILSRKNFIITSSTLSSPLSSCIFKIILYFFISFNYILRSLKK